MPRISSAAFTSRPTSWPLRCPAGPTFGGGVLPVMPAVAPAKVQDEPFARYLQRDRPEARRASMPASQRRFATLA